MTTTTPDRRIGTRARLLIVLGVLAVIFGGLALLAYNWLHAGYVTRPAVGAGPIPGTVAVSRVPSVMEQIGTCDGIGEPQHLARYVRPLHIDTIVFCPFTAGEATREVKRTAANASEFDALSQVLSHNDSSGRRGSCPAVLPIVAPFVTTVSGQRLRPAVPLDECGFPQPAVMSALEALRR